MEVNLTAQHLIYYKDGKVVVDSDFVSGDVAKRRRLPTGAYGLYYKERNRTLRGQGYASPVSFWMPFNGGVGFHDAKWRGSFGGDYYKWKGSHGCVNLPYSAAKTLFENIESGCAVLVYTLPERKARCLRYKKRGVENGTDKREKTDNFRCGGGFGVSKTTVSRAISGKGRIGKDTPERVLTYIEKHNYKPNVLAKGLAQLKTYNIGVMLPEDYTVVDLPFFQSCLVGIEETAISMDYDILLTMSRGRDCAQLMRMVENHKVDGVILMRTFMQDAHVEYLKTQNIPFVTVGSSNYQGVVQVDSDHRSACRNWCPSFDEEYETDWSDWRY